MTQIYSLEKGNKKCIHEDNIIIDADELIIWIKVAQAWIQWETCFEPLVLTIDN